MTVTGRRLTESQLRRIIYEELLEHYLVQKELWEDQSKIIKKHQDEASSDQTD